MERIKKLLVYTIFFPFVLLVSTCLYGGDSFRECLIQTRQCSPDELKDIIYFIEEQGGQVVHVFPSTIIHARINEIIEKTLRKTGYADLITDETIKTSGAQNVDDSPGIIAWNYKLKPKSKGFFDQEGTIYNDMIINPEEEALSRGGVEPRQRTSAYMAGTCAVSIVFVECDGTVERAMGSWTEAKKELVLSQIYEGLDWWAQEGGKKAHITWVYDDVHTVTIDREPGNYALNEDSVWVRRAIQKVYKKNPHYTHLFQCSLYAGELRKRLKTDWGFVIFVCENSNDPDGYFKDGGFAYARLGGPYMVLTYKNNGWGANQIGLVTAHEAGHIFRALDEYKESGSGLRMSGELNVENGNHELYGVISEACMMKHNSKRLCKYTLGQIGWRDDDNDGKFDPDETWKHPPSRIKPITEEIKPPKPPEPEDTLYPEDIVITTIPENASVYFNDVFKGMSPVNLKGFSYGTYEMRIMKPGYLEHREQIKLSKNSMLPPKKIQLRVIDEVEAFAENLLNDNPDIMITAAIDKPQYVMGDNLYLSFITDVDCYFYLIDISPDNEIAIVFPNDYSSNNRIESGRKYTVPDERASFDLSVTGPPGKDRLIFLASKTEMSEIKNIPQEDGRIFIKKLSDFMKSQPKDGWASRLLYFTIK